MILAHIVAKFYSLLVTKSTGANLLVNLYKPIAKNISKFMVFYFYLAWKVVRWFPYIFIAGTLAAGVHIRVEVELD